MLISNWQSIVNNFGLLILKRSLLVTFFNIEWTFVWWIEFLWILNCLRQLYLVCCRRLVFLVRLVNFLFIYVCINCPIFWEMIFYSDISAESFWFRLPDLRYSCRQIVCKYVLKTVIKFSFSKTSWEAKVRCCLASHLRLRSPVHLKVVIESREYH